MDGYRLCHEIRTDDRLRNLPIIIYTSTYTSLSDEKLALSMGADKYLKKPAPAETILSALHEVIATQHTTPRPEPWQEVEVLKEYSDGLVRKLEERNIELAEANEKLTILDRSKNEFLNLISHEFRTPLHGLLGVGELILGLTGENHELKGLYRRARQRMLWILDDALLLTEIDVNEGTRRLAAPVSLSTALGRAIESTKELAKSHSVALAALPAHLGFVLGDEELLVRAFRSLLGTAVKFSEKGETVGLSCDLASDTQTVIVECHGRTIPDPVLAKFFDVFSISEAIIPGGDFGLGLPVAYRILSLFGASVSVANRTPPEIRLTIVLKNVERRAS
jgi:signal transduction histidine kinase